MSIYTNASPPFTTWTEAKVPNGFSARFLYAKILGTPIGKLRRKAVRLKFLIRLRADSVISCQTEIISGDAEDGKVKEFKPDSN